MGRGAARGPGRACPLAVRPAVPGSAVRARRCPETAVAQCGRGQGPGASRVSVPLCCRCRSRSICWHISGAVRTGAAAQEAGRAEPARSVPSRRFARGPGLARSRAVAVPGVQAHDTRHRGWTLGWAWRGLQHVLLSELAGHHFGAPAWLRVAA